MNDAEFQGRLARARALMVQGGLDALLLASGPNLFYLTGLPHGRSGSRPYVLVIPGASDPVLLVHEARQYEARLFSYVRDVQTYAGLSRAPVPAIASLLHSRGLRKVGMEMGQEHYLDLLVTDLADLRAALPGVEFVDAGALLWRLRKIKSAAEVAAIAAACRITGDAYEETLAGIRVGMPEIQIEAAMCAAMLARGGGSPWVLITSGPGNYDLVSKGGTERPVERGDMVWLDAGCTVEGYYSDFSRAGVIGGPGDAQSAAQAQIHAITMAAVAMLRPGVRVATVAATCDDALSRLDFPITSSISGLAGRVGHGLGLAVTEWPSLTRDSDETLEADMVVTIEPGVATSFGAFHVEQNVLVTETGPLVLSEAPWELRSLAH